MASKPNWKLVAGRLIYRGYPDSDLLPIDPPAESETIGDFADRAEGAGDTLFLFLCREANDDIDVEEYLHWLDRALRDIEQVRDAFAELAADAAPRLPSSPGLIP